MNENKTPTEVENKPKVENDNPTIKEDAVVEKDKTDDVTFDESQNNNAEPKEDVKTEISKSEQNRINAQRRIEEKKRLEEKRLKELQDAKREGVIEGLDKKNPYTETEIKDEADYNLYLVQKEMKDKGLEYMDLVEVHRYQANKIADEQKKLNDAKIKEEESTKKFEKDYEDFTTKHPDIDIEKLNNDELFMTMFKAEISTGGTLSTAWDKFDKLYLQKFESEKAAFILKERAKGKASPIVSETQETGESEFYSEEQLRKMTPKEIRENMDKVNRSYKRFQSSK